jgi:hypothetical protein
VGTQKAVLPILPNLDSAVAREKRRSFCLLAAAAANDAGRRASGTIQRSGMAGERFVTPRWNLNDAMLCMSLAPLSE